MLALHGRVLRPASIISDVSSSLVKCDHPAQDSLAAGTPALDPAPCNELFAAAESAYRDANLSEVPESGHRRCAAVDAGQQDRQGQTLPSEHLF